MAKQGDPDDFCQQKTYKQDFKSPSLPTPNCYPQKCGMWKMKSFEFTTWTKEQKYLIKTLLTPNSHKKEGPLSLKTSLVPSFLGAD